MALLPRLLINAAAMLRMGLLQRVIGLLLVTVLSRLLDPKGLGAFNFVQSTSNTFAGMTRLGLDAGLHVELAAQTAPEDRQRIEAVLGETLSLFLLIAAGMGTVLLLFARPIAESMFAAPDLGLFVRVSAVLLVAQMLSQYSYAAFAGLHAFSRYSRITMLGTIGSSLLTIAGSWVDGAWGGVLGLATGQAVMMVLLATGLSREAASRQLRVRPRLPGAEAWAVMTLGLPFYLSVAAMIPVDFMNLGLLSRSAGVGELGELRVTQALMSLAAFIPTALSGPTISHLAAANAGERNPDPVLLQLKVNWVLGLLIVEGLSAIWPLAIDVVFGGSYPAARGVGVMALAAFLPGMLASVMTAGLLARKRTLILLVVGLLQACAYYVGGELLIPRTGLGGFLGAQALSAVVGVGALIAALTRIYGQSFLTGWMAAFLLLTAIVASLLLMVVIFNAGILLRLAVGVVCACATLATAWMSLRPEERTRMRSLLAGVSSRLSASRLADTNGR